jgi:cob(I)alamin adenosyltransferase
MRESKHCPTTPLRLPSCSTINIMAFEYYKTKESVVIVYTGEGKGKTSAALGLLVRALGNRWRVAFIQFIKYWGVGEHVFMRDIQSIYGDQLHFYKGGKGFYQAGDLSEQHISDEQHQQAALETYEEALKCVSSGDFDLVICDEINNAVHDGLLNEKQLKQLITKRSPKTSLCMTGRDFPDKLLKEVDIATNMTKLKHHFDKKFLANKGIDF